MNSGYSLPNLNPDETIKNLMCVLQKTKKNLPESNPEKMAIKPKRL
jgi:hypothetical protein